MTKKVHKQKYFFLSQLRIQIGKILPKNLVPLKDQMVLKMKKKQYRGGDCLKRGAWTVCRFKGGLKRKREEGCF